MTRIADQDPAFLRFIESNDLKPGQRVEVETRDPAADSVLLRGRRSRRITIGARAASKLLVEVAAGHIISSPVRGLRGQISILSWSFVPFVLIQRSNDIEPEARIDQSDFRNSISVARCSLESDWKRLRAAAASLP